MADKTANAVICPICKNSFEINGTISKCPICGHAAYTDELIEKTKKTSSESDVEIYRLMAAADAYFAKKSYDEAYIGYTSVLEHDRNVFKAYFRRELTSHYLMMESSTVYLSCEGFFSQMGEITERFRTLDMDDPDVKRLRITMCRDMIEYMSERSDYEKKYASAHRNAKTVEVYMSNMILLFEYCVQSMRILEKLDDEENSKEIAYLIIDCCTLTMKIKGMLTAGAEYVETVDKMDDMGGGPAAKNVSRIRRRMLTQDEELKIETDAGYVLKVKNNVVSNAQGELYTELRAAKDASESKVNKEIVDDDKKRAEYEIWRKRNEQEYMAADKHIIVFDIAGKAAIVFAIIMVTMFLIEFFTYNRSLEVILVIAAVFAVGAVALNILKKSAEKKKGFYAKVIEGDSANLRSSGGSFKEL